MKLFLSGILLLTAIASADDLVSEAEIKLAIEEATPAIGTAIDKIYSTIFDTDSLAHYNTEDLQALSSSALLGRMLSFTYLSSGDDTDPVMKQAAKNAMEADIKTIKNLKDQGMTLMDIINNPLFTGSLSREAVLKHCPECSVLYDEMVDGIPIDSYFVSIQVFKDGIAVRSLSSIIDVPKFRSEQVYTDLNSTNRNRFLDSLGYEQNIEMLISAKDWGSEDSLYGTIDDNHVGFRYEFFDSGKSFTLGSKLCIGVECSTEPNKTLSEATGLIDEEYSYWIDFYKMGVELLKTE